MSVPLWDMLEKSGTIGGRFVLARLALSRARAGLVDPARLLSSND